MSETPLSYGERPLSTAWLPLEGLCEQWASVACEAHATGLLEVTGLAFQAFAHEQRAHTHYEQAKYASAPAAFIMTLDQATEVLSQARQCWSDAIRALERQTSNLHALPAHRELAASLLAQAWDEYVRMTALLLEVEQVQQARQRDYYGAACASKLTAGKDK